MSNVNWGRRAVSGSVFLKFYKREHDEVMWYSMVSSRIELPEETWNKVEKVLKPLGITFRSPNR